VVLRRWCVLVLVGVLGCVMSWTVGAASALDRPAARDTPTSREFVGVLGTRSVGPTFPILAHQPGRRDAHGKQLGAQSLFFVVTDAASAMSAFAARARQLGYAQPATFTDARCGSAPQTMPGEPVARGDALVRCGAHYERPDGTSVEIAVQVCESCPDPLSAASVTVARYPRTVDPLGEPRPIADLPADAPTLVLSPSALREQRTPGDATLARSVLRPVEGARLAMPVWDAGGGLCSSADATVLSIPGPRSAAALDRAAEETLASGRTSTVTATLGGRRVTQRTSERLQTTLVGGGEHGHPWMLLTACTSD
jgi:hypothetical protein